jgi:hypothetical protein
MKSLTEESAESGMTVKDIVDHARVAIELFSKEEIALRRDASAPCCLLCVVMRIAWDGPAGTGDTACRPPAKGWRSA